MFCQDWNPKVLTAISWPLIIWRWFSFLPFIVAWQCGRKMPTESFIGLLLLKRPLSKNLHFGCFLQKKLATCSVVHGCQGPVIRCGCSFKVCATLQLGLHFLAKLSVMYQWHSHWGSRGAGCHLDSEKFAKNRKRGKKSGKKRKNWEEKAKIGKVLSLCPLLTDRAGYATVMYTLLCSKLTTLLVSPNWVARLFFW